MKITNRWMTCLVLLAIGSLPMVAMAEHRWVGFSELVHRAHVIFDGRVIDQVSWESDDGKMIYTDMTFDLIDLVHADPKALAYIGDTITITMPGGTFGGRSLDVCTAPHLEQGERVLLCAYLDGKKHISPVVGGDQGVFRIMERGRHLEPIPTKGHAFGLLGIQDEYVHVSPRIDRIEENEGVFLPPPRLAPMGRSLDHNPDPVATVLRGRGELMTLRQLKTAMQERLEIPFDAQAVADVPTPQRLPIPPGKELSLNDRDADDPPVVSPMCVCGDHRNGALYEIPPPGSINRDDELYAMSHWNRFVNNWLWTYKDMDDPCGNNFENETGVFADEEFAEDCFGIDWEDQIPYGGDSPARAVCQAWTELGGCDDEIIEVDTIYNTQHHWQEYTAQTYRKTSLHELGHSWGFFRGDCAETYQYDQLTVMARGPEPGDGLHAADAYYIRAVYEDYLGPFGDVADVGCETYIQTEGFIYNGNCTQATELDYYIDVEPGDVITLNNILIENISSIPAPTTLSFFASRDRALDEDEDILLGMFGFDEMPAFSSASGNYTMTIPDYLPPGNHYILLRSYIWDWFYNDRNPDNSTNNQFRGELRVTNTTPVNDNCNSSQAIGEGSWIVDNRWANTDGGSLSLCDDEFMYPMWHDVWYAYQTDCAGTLELDTCGNWGFNTIIAVYEDTGACPPDPNSLVACNDDVDICQPYRSSIVAPAEANTNYLIRIGTPFPEDIGSPGGSMGESYLNVSYWTDVPAGVPNDECAGATVIDKGSHELSTTCATTNGAIVPNPSLCTDDGEIYNDVWYSFTPSCSGTARLTGYSEQFDTAIAVYDGAYNCFNYSDTALLGSACATPENPSPRVDVLVEAGQELLIRIGGQDPVSQGGASLIAGLIQKAPNDYPADAIQIESNNVPFDTSCAISDGIFHAGCGPIENDVWYRYDSDIDGDLEILTCGLADFDVEMAVYIDTGSYPPYENHLTGCTNRANLCANGTEILTTRVRQDTSYLIRIGGGHPDARGPGTMKLHPVAGCIADVTSVDGSAGVIDITDMLAILGDWGQLDSPYDVDGDRLITIADLLIVLDAWGPCPTGCEDPFLCEPDQDIFDYVCGGDGKTSLCACMQKVVGLDDTCIDVTGLLGGYPCDELQQCWEDCPPGYECVTIECCPGWNRYCLPICPAP